MTPFRFTMLRRVGTALALVAAATGAQSAVGVATLAPTGDDGPVTVFYPTDAAARRETFGPGVALDLARDAAPAAGNGRLVIVSHGTGGSAWVHGDLIAELVRAGFTVGAPLHAQDNHRDHSRPGPASFERRPAEASRAADAVLADPRFAALRGDRIGLYGMSAGGHTALSMAGGRWSPARLRDHCAANLVEDWAFCSGLNARLTGGPLDGLKLWVARVVHRIGLSDPREHEHHDARFAAIVAAVPVAADFDPASLARPRMPLAFVTAGQDRWLVPRFHAERVLAACTTCVRLAALPDAGHGAYLGPLPNAYTGVLAEMLNDPPGFDRGVMPAVNRSIAAFFERNLLARPADL